MPDQPVESVTLTIDGQQITVPKGTLVIRAAEQLGTIIPRFCDHPLLDPVGACRQCVVEIEGQRKPVMSCTQPVSDGMEVRTHLTDPVARKAQQGTLEFLLINHPLDCPMCDKGGECPLQDQAMAHGSNTSRFVDQKRRYDKPVAVSSQILLDRERCVLCARCTRFSEQIAGDPFIELFERGALEQVAMYEDEPYDSYFSGNIIQICPVGALTSADYRFKARPFDVVTTPSVCDHCSAGCTLTVQSRRGEVQRQLARTNMAVNEAWNCDKGRFGFHHLTAPTRLTEPQLREGGELTPTSWATALTTVTSAVSEARQAGPGRVAVLTGARLADEDAYVVGKYVRATLGSDDLDFRTRFAPAGEAVELTSLAARDSATYADVEAAGVIVVAGLDTEEEVPILHLRIRKAWRSHGAKIVVVGPDLGSLRDLAWRHVPTDVGGEAAALAELAGADSEIAEALAAADGPVVLVGERAGAGSITAADGLADRIAGRSGYVPRRAGSRGAVAAGLLASALPGGRRLTDAADRAEVEAVWGCELPAEPGRDLNAVLTAAAAGEIDVLHLVGVDLLRDAASTELARAALDKVPMVVVQDLAETDTVRTSADVVLPAAARQERSGTATNWEGRRQRFSRAIDAPGVAQQDWEIVVQIAGLLGSDLGLDSLEAVRAEMAVLGTRSQPHPLETSGPVDTDTDDRTDGGDAGTEETHAAAEDGTGDGPAVLARPLLIDRGTMLTGATDLAATSRTPEAVLSAATAAEHGITDGDPVEVTGASAAMVLTAAVRHGVADGVVVIPTNATEVPVGALADTEGRITAGLRRLEDAEQPAEEVA